MAVMDAVHGPDVISQGTNSYAAFKRAMHVAGLGGADIMPPRAVT